MKKLFLVLLLAGLTGAVHATSVSVDYTDGGLYPNGVGNPCDSGSCGTLVSGSQSQVTLTPEPLQTIINNNNITIPSSVGVGVNGSVETPSANADFVGSGLGVSTSGDTTHVDLSNLQTTQGTTNTTDITNLSNLVNTNSTDLTNVETQVDQNTSDISTLNTGLTTTNQNLSNETDARVAGDQQLQTNIDNETSRALSAENNLQNQVNNVNDRVNDVDNRVNKLEQTKYVGGVAVRLYDTKRFEVQAFDDYNMRSKRNDVVGMRMVFKLGKSYEEKLLAQQAAQLAEMSAMLHQMQTGSSVSVKLGDKVSRKLHPVAEGK